MQTASVGSRPHFTSGNYHTDGSRRSKNLGPLPNRRLCGSPQHTATTLLEPLTGPSSDCDGCFPADMAEEGTLSPPAMESDSEGTAPISPTASCGSYFSDAMVDDPILVPYDSLTHQRESNSNANQPKMDVSRLAVITKCREAEGIDPIASQFLSRNQRRRTTQIYDRGWALWCRWNHNQSPPTDPLTYYVNHILRFFMAHNH